MVLPHSAVIAIVVILESASIASADATAAQGAGRSITPVWTVVGAGAGFGLGLVAGLAVFDDAIDSERKVWTTAIVSAAVGGTLGWLVDRRHARRAGTANPSRRTVLLMRQQEQQIIAAGGRLGAGELKRWLELRHELCFK